MAMNLAAAKPALDALKNIIESNKKSNAKPVDYDSPSWAYKQAHENGFNQALRLIESLIP